MNKYYLLGLILISQLAPGQNTGITTGTFVIRGKALNFSEKEWSFAKTDFFDIKSFQVEIKNDGSFDKAFFTDGVQDLYLNLNKESITIFVEPGDTLLIEWNERDFVNTFKIRSKAPSRNSELQLSLLLYNTFRKPYFDLRTRLGQNRDAHDSIKFNWINQQYNQVLRCIFSNTLTKNTEKFINRFYFEYTELLRSNNLLPGNPLIPDNSLINPENSSTINSLVPKTNHYKLLRDKTFYECPQYRDFLFNYIRFNHAFIGYSNLVSEKNEVLPFTPGLSDYYRGLAEIKIIPIRDWFITKVIFNSFEAYTFEESDAIIKDFLPKCKTRLYLDTLTSFYEMVKKFKSGNPAPPFTLKDPDGKLVSLIDFQGKVVFIDFWGVGCAPCRYEIANAVPELHEKYSEKGVVFVNICVDSDQETWKKTLKEIKLDGINLIAEGWTNNKVCKDYNINGIPHYVLLDKHGRFVNANMARPSAIIRGQNDEIDNLLTIDK